MNERLPSVAELATALTEEIGHLQDPREATAHLEAKGLTDRDARTHYAQPDLFALGDEVLRHQQADVELLRQADEEEAARVAETRGVARAGGLHLLRMVIRGAAYGMPMGISTFASVILLYSLWSYYYFTGGQATAIGLGSALSYFVAGGFTQAIGRRGLAYLRQDMYLMTLKVAWFFVASGIAAAALVALTFPLLFSFFPMIPPAEANLAMVYFLGLSVLWLCLAVLYMLDQELMFTVAVLAGLGVVYWLREHHGLDMVVAHQVGIAVAAVFSLSTSSAFLLRKHRRHEDAARSGQMRLPRAVMLLSSVRTYVAYGSLYFTLLFTDRLLAWTGRMDFRQSFVWFRADYEAGLNWALLGMLPAFTVLEIVLQRFGRQMRPRQVDHRFDQTRQFSDGFLRFYLRQTLLYLTVALAGIALAYRGLLAVVPSIPELAIIDTPVPRFTFAVGVIGYLAIGFALLNLSVFFWLSRPRLAMLSLLPGLVTNIAIGYVLSRTVSYEYAVFGLTVGGLVFAVISTVLCLRVMSNLDYYYYSAF